MKPVAIIMVIALANLALAQYDNPSQTVYEKLSQVNKEWLAKDHDSQLLNKFTIFHSDEELIQLHLQLVESNLRATSTSHLNNEQKYNRNQSLNYLRKYWEAASFPKNTHHDIRIPYFIDDFGTVCAVGHLLVETGYGPLAKKIRDETNYAYVREMEYPELMAWADKYGFTVDELAWIQPAYSTNPPYVWTDISAGVSTTVKTIAIDESANVMYVSADYGTNGNNIRSYDGYNWGNMAGGVNGPVNVILVDDNNVYVGGDFTMAGGINVNYIAIWNGNQWQAIGSGLPGAVTALAIFNNELYAAGQFPFPTIFPQAILVKWDGTDWTPILADPVATINALEVYSKQLYIGGAFDNINGLSTSNLVVYDENGFADMGGYGSTVLALEVYKDTLFIGGEFTFNDSTYETTGLEMWDGTTLTSITNSFSWSIPYQGEHYYINSLATFGDKMFATGKFDYWPMYGFHGSNAVVFTDIWDANGVAWGADSTINTAAEFNGAMILGGDFTMLGGNSANRLVSSGDIASSVGDLQSPSSIKIYNHAEKAIIAYEGLTQDKLNFALIDMQGKEILSFLNLRDNKVEIQKSDLAAGAYIFNFYFENEIAGTGQLVVQ